MKSITKHTFLLMPGRWIGEGKIAFSYSPTILRFYTEWEDRFVENKPLAWQQTVEIQGQGEKNINHFTLYEIKSESFVIELENRLIHKTKGKGIIHDNILAWEFFEKDHFEGFETFEFQENGDYIFHAEYYSSDHYRTVIDGRLWKKTTNS